jgi:hypothetical protein
VWWRVWWVWIGTGLVAGDNEESVVMAQYLLSNVTPAGRALDPAELQRVIARVVALTQEMQAAGVWVFAMPLADPSTATVVSRREGRVHLADGPFAETKEYIGGFTVIDVADLDAAVRWADKVSDATGLSVEVRPAASFGG